MLAGLTKSPDKAGSTQEMVERNPGLEKEIESWYHEAGGIIERRELANWLYET